MGRYDDDDSEYVAYGNVSGGLTRYDKEKEQKRLFEEKYASLFSVSDRILDDMSTDDIEDLSSLLSELSKGDITQETKQKMVKFGASEALLKDDIKQDFTDGAYVEKGAFSLHSTIIEKFRESMENIAKQDNNKSLYLRLTMMTKYHQFGEPYEKVYEDPKRRLYFMKTYLSTHPQANISSFRIGGYNPSQRAVYDGTLLDVLEGIAPKDAVDFFINIKPEKISSKEGADLHYFGNSTDKAIPYITAVVADARITPLQREHYIAFMAGRIQKQHYSGVQHRREVPDAALINDKISDHYGWTYYWNNTPYTEAELQFYEDIDRSLPERAKTAYEIGDLETLQLIAAGISYRQDPRNPKTAEFTPNQSEFFDKYLPQLDNENIPLSYVKTLSGEKFELWIDKQIENPRSGMFSSEVWQEYKSQLARMNEAPEEKQQEWINKIRYEDKRLYFEEYLTRKGISLYDATEFARFIRGKWNGHGYDEPQTDKLPEIIKEGFWISSTEDKIKAYKKICGEIYAAHNPPADDAKNAKIREVGSELLKKLKREHPLREVDLAQLDNKTLLVLTFIGDVKDKKISIENSDNKIDEALLQSGKLKISARSQVARSPVSPYCDINETWVDLELYGCKTNLLDRKLQRDAIRDVIDLINRGADVSVKVERANRDNQKFSISPFDRYISGILYRGKSNAIAKLGEDMQKIAREVNPDKLFVMNRIFRSLSYKIRNDARVQEMERKVNQIVFERNLNSRGGNGKVY